MSLQKIYKKISKKSWGVAIFAVLFFGVATFTFAQIGPIDTLPEIEEEGPVTIDPPVIDPENPEGLTEGSVWGYGWMGTGISNPNSSEGGGGWLKFNCEPDVCDQSPSEWGTRVNLDENSPLYGHFYGQAWSNNYGWLDFSSDNVSSCWEANPLETLPDTAKILFPSGKVVGWAKFIAGDDIPDDGWDGCVSFSGTDYGATVDLDTGALKGWAWGSSVVGWISFQNPECPFCDATVVLDRIIGCMDPTATNYNPLANAPGRCTYGPPVRGCMDPTATNYNPLATIPGRCTYASVPGCTNPLATNYNPLATVDDGSCRFSGGPRPTLDLQATPNTLYVGSGNYITGLTWTSSAPSQLSGCVGSLTGTNIMDTGTQTNWDGSQSAPNITTPLNVDLAPYAVNAVSGNQYTFRLTCNRSGGGTIFDMAVVNMIDPIDPPVTSSIWLHIEEPNIPSTGSLLSEIISPNGVNPLTLRWEAVNVVADSCTADSIMYSGSTTTEIGPNASWSGQTLSLDGNDQGTQNLNITSPSVINNTKFQITCVPLGDTNTTISAQVCMGIDGRTFPASACSAGNSINRPPGYKEI